MSQPPFSIKWTIIGAAIIIGINWMLVAALQGVIASAWAMLAVVAVGSFFVGGLIIGWASPGETLKEPAVAATLAIVFNLAMHIGTGGSAGVVDVVVTIALGYGLGLAGAKVGEKLQGDTTDKMRERGEL